MAKLYRTYIYTLTNFSRGFSDDYPKCTNQETVNKIMFDYYAEIFYYYLVSVRDVIAQILCVKYFKSYKKEHNLKFNKEFIKKIDNSEIQELLLIFMNKTVETVNNYRNAFAHRYPPTMADYRTEISIENGRKSIGFGFGKQVESVKIVENMNYSLIALFDLMRELKRIVK
jgi:hypothetical protein